MKRNRPFGHTPEQAAAIVRAADLLIGGTATSSSIAKEWNTRGFRRAEGGPWATDMVKRTLRNKNARDAIGDPAVFDALQARLSRKAMAPVVPPFTERLTGLARCGTCGATMQFKPVVNAPDKYVCIRTNYGTHERDGRNHPQVQAPIFEGKVRQRIVQEVMTHGAGLVGFAPRPLDDLAVLIGAELSLKRTMLDLVGQPGSGVTEHDLLPRVRQIEAEVAVLEAERSDRLLADALARLDADTIEEVASNWDELDIASQQIVARRLVTVTVYVGRGADRVHVDLVNAA